MKLTSLFVITLSTSSTEAMQSMEKLSTAVESNPDTARWLKSKPTTQSEQPEYGGASFTDYPGRPTDDDTGSIVTVTQARRHRRAFEKVLFATHVYKRVSPAPGISPRSSIAPRAGWSMLSRESLAKVSNLSVLSLPVCRGEIYNPQRYHDNITGSSSAIPTQSYPAAMFEGEYYRYLPETSWLPSETIGNGGDVEAQ
jgi:hypothetical protein